MSSTSAPQTPKLPAGGRATITGLVILANPRMLPASKTLVLDAQFYLGSMDQGLIMGSLRYFNSDSSTFDEEPNLYFVHTTFARRESGADVPVSGDRTHSDYSFVGDIEWFILLGKPGQRYLSSHEDNTSGSQTHPDILPTLTIDPRRKPFIQVTGVAMELSKEKATFEVTVEQYISCLRFNPSTPQAGGTHLKPTTTFFCHIPDLPKFKTWTKKPLPGNKRYVSISGFLTGVDTSGNGSKVEQFRIDIENVTFCGQYVPPVHTIPSPQSSPVKTQGRALFAYDLRTPPREPSAPP